MSDTEELLRAVLRLHAEEAPGMHDLQLDTPPPSHRWRWMAPLAVATVTAALVLGVVSLSQWHRGTTDTASAPGPDLTGIMFTDIDRINQGPDERSTLFSTDRDGNASRVSTSDMDMSSADWSPDGSQIAFIGLRQGDVFPGLYIMSADGTDITSVLQRRDVVPTDVAWSADGSSIYFGTTDDHDSWFVVKNIDLATGSVTTVPNSSGSVRFAVSPLGDRLAIVRNTAVGRNTGESVSTFVLSTTDGSVIEEMPGDDRTPAWSPDGQRLAYSDDQGQWVLQDMTSGTTEALDPPSEGLTIGEVAWGPDENYLIVSTAAPDSRIQLFVMDVSAGTYQPVDIDDRKFIVDISWGAPPAPTPPG